MLNNIDKYEELKLIINNFLSNGELTKITVNLYPIEWFEECITELGWTYNDLSTNGWQVDWWLTFHKEDKELCVSGCLYYDNTIIIEKQ